MNERDTIWVGIDGAEGFGKRKMAGKAIIARANSVNKDRHGKALSVKLGQ